MMAELVDGLACLAHRLLADRAGVSPLQREVLPQQHAELVGRVVQLGSARCARERATDRDRRRGPTPRLASNSAGVASPNAMRVGARFAPLTNIGSPLTVKTQSCSTTSRSPVRTAAGIADHIVDRDLDLDVGQLLVAERPRPPQPWIVDVEVPVDFVEAARQRLLVLIE